jgi:enoyl-CoA hydratase
MLRPDAARTAPLGFSGLEPGKPRVAAVEGYCVGGGVELACWCDIRVAGEGAVFAALNRRVGVPWVDGGTQRLPRIVGQGNALHLLLTGERVDARRAQQMGLVQEVVPEGTAVDRALELAQAMAGYPQSSLLADREATVGALGLPLAEGLAREGRVMEEAALLGELAEGVRGFEEEGG